VKKILGGGRSDSASAPDALPVLAALEEGIAAARALGLDVSRAESVSAEGADRLGITPDAYVVALVGGTGVGKSTILNALAMETVSAAGVRRPTTGEPVAWVAAAALDAVRPLLARLGINRPRIHDGAGLDRVVIVDLPDVDSLESGHRAIVEELLPKIDVVAWVVDPEKYGDAVLHDDFLRDWMPRLGRQVVILNKVDRLDDDARRSVTADVRHLVRQVLPADVPVIATAAAQGEAGIAELRAWMADAASAKAVVAARLAAAGRAALAGLAAAAGVAGGTASPLVSDTEQQRAIEGSTDEILRVVDLRGAERQAVALTRAGARRRGTGPIGLLTTAIYRFSGRQRASANPAEFLRGWRNRGGLVRATELIRRAIEDVLPSVPPALRGQYAAAGQSGDLEARLGDAVDRVVFKHAEMDAPTSRFWPVIGLLQTANTLLLVFSVAWVILWVIARPDVATYDLPVLGPVAAPMVLLFVALALGYILARLLGLHAGWLGSRWAKRTSGGIRTGIREGVAAQAFAPIARIEAARHALAEALARSR
jgi:GTP-binding protein EngB required for normal cell division